MLLDTRVVNGLTHEGLGEKNGPPGANQISSTDLMTNVHGLKQWLNKEKASCQAQSLFTI